MTALLYEMHRRAEQGEAMRRGLATGLCRRRQVSIACVSAKPAHHAGCGRRLTRRGTRALPGAGRNGRACLGRTARGCGFKGTKSRIWIGWFLLVIGLFKPIFDFIAARWVFSIVKIQNPTLSPPIDLDVAWILVSLIVLILSTAFPYGVELEKEHSLTV